MWTIFLFLNLSFGNSLKKIGSIDSYNQLLSPKSECYITSEYLNAWPFCAVTDKICYYEFYLTFLKNKPLCFGPVSDHMNRIKENKFPSFEEHLEVESSIETGVEIVEILNLQEKAILNPNLFKDYKINDIARNLVRRKSLKENKISNLKINYFNDTEIQLFFHDTHLSSILKYGFKNGHQVGYGTLDFNFYSRANAENDFIGIRLEKVYCFNRQCLSHRLRPKYGFITIKSNPSLYHNPQQQKYFSKEWGNIIAVLKNEVKNRSTLSRFDSLELDDKKNGIVTFFANYLPDTKSETGTPQMWEAQIWGSLTSSDVDHFLVNCEGLDTVSPSNISLIKKSGRPVFFCDSVKKNNLVVSFKKGRPVQ